MSSEADSKIELSVSPVMLSLMMAAPVINALYSALKDPDFVEKLKEYHVSATAIRRAL